MVSSAATTVKDYIAELPADRQKPIKKVRATLRKHLPKGYREGMQHGMIAYFVPLSRYADTYNGQPLTVAALASQKRHMSVYLMGLYADEDLRRRFEEAYEASGKMLDAGKSCVRFKKLDDLPLAVLADAIAALPVDEYVALAEAAKGQRGKQKRGKQQRGR